MPIKLGDIVKLYKKNIHVSAQTKHFKELADGDFVLVRVKNIEHRGEHRQRKLTATVTWPARLQDGQPIVWEGITLLKNLHLEEAAADEPDAPGADSSPAKRPAHAEVDLDYEVSDGDSDRIEDEDPEGGEVRGPREGWKWAPCTIDGRADESAYTGGPAYLVHSEFDSHSPYQWFLHYFVSDFFRDHMLPLINTAFKEAEHVTINEMNGWFAVLIAKAQWGVPDEVFWQLPIATKLSAVMDPHRFKAIWLAMDPTRATWGDPNDPHRHVTPLINAFNQRMLETFKPGADLCLDESMLLWLGKVYLMDGWVVHPRKPDPKGFEFKTVCDVLSSILMRMELCCSEENKYIRQKEFFSYTQSLRNAQIMRMCKPWFGTGRTVTADSGFGSPAAVALLRENGLFSNMMIKKARYWPQWVPNDILDKLPAAFDSVVSCSKSITTPGNQSFKVSLTAHRDMVPRLYCHTMGVSTPHPERFLMYKRIGKKDHTELKLHEVQPPQIGMHYSRTRNAVDVFNGHRKRPKTELVETLYCSNPQHKVVLMILACIECNAKLSWSHFTSDRADDWWTFRSLLVDKMIHIASEQVHLRKKDSDPAPEASRHHLIYVKRWSERDKALMWPQGLPRHLRGRCSECNRIVASVCNCSRTTWLCDGDCFPRHVAKKLIVENDE
jgi:hypothetical protein